MSRLLGDFYRGKRILVTGHTGFQGGWIVAWLKLLGAQVYGYGLPPAARPNFFDATALDRGMTSIFGDIRDRNALANIFSESQPEIVIHCAGRSNRQLSHNEPVEAFSTNVMGTVHVLEEARLTKSVRALVIVSGSPHNESGYAGHDLPGKMPDVHDASLNCAEIASSAFANSLLSNDRTGVANARSVDSVGGGDWREGHLIPNLVRSIMYGEPVRIEEDPELRLCHVLELVHGFLLLAKRLFEAHKRHSGSWDFMPAESQTVRAHQLAKHFVTLWDAPDSPSEADSRAKALGKSRAESELGWSSLLQSDQAIAWTVEWYRAFYSETATAWRTTEHQIDRYLRMTNSGNSR